MILSTKTVLPRPGRDVVTRRRFLTASAGVAGTAASGHAFADSLADVPPRAPGAPMSGRSERFQVC
jgi:sulfane dehydrogenase subunit SoxC